MLTSVNKCNQNNNYITIKTTLVIHQEYYEPTLDGPQFNEANCRHRCLNTRNAIGTHSFKKDTRSSPTTGDDAVLCNDP